MRKPEILKLAEEESNGCPEFMKGVTFALGKISRGGAKKKVVRIKYGEPPVPYDSISEAVMENPISDSSVREAMKTGKLSKGYFWKEV